MSLGKVYQVSILVLARHAFTRDGGKICQCKNEIRITQNNEQNEWENDFSYHNHQASSLEMASLTRISVIKIASI